MGLSVTRCARHSTELGVLLKSFFKSGEVPAACDVTTVPQMPSKRAKVENVTPEWLTKPKDSVAAEAKRLYSDEPDVLRMLLRAHVQIVLEALGVREAGCMLPPCSSP